MLKSHCFSLDNVGKDAGHPIAKLALICFTLAMLGLGTGCSTMPEPPFTTSSADSYGQHQQKNDLVVGIHPVTDRAEINGIFKVDLLDKGLLPILVVVENKSQAASFIMAREKVGILNEATGTTSASQRKKVTTSTGETMANVGGVMVALGGFSLGLAVIGAPIEIIGAQKASTASMIEFNLADKELYTHTLGPGQKAQGFVYFQLPKDSPALGNCHVVAEAKNPATGEATTFDFSVNLNPPKQ